MKTNDNLNRSRRNIFVAAIFLVWMASHARSLAATVPAGTTVVVTTIAPLSSHESRGRTFKTELTADLKAGGKTVVPAGTTIFGVVETSRNQMGGTRTSPLVVNLISVEINGQRIPIKSTGGVSPETLSQFSGLQRRTGASAGKSILPRGTKLEFRLAEPLRL